MNQNFVKRPTPRKQAMGMLLVIAMVGIVVWYVNSGRGPELPQLKGVAPETLGDIGLEGHGGDGELNKQKNRNTLPPSFTEMTVGQIVSISSAELNGEGRQRRLNWSTVAKDYLQQRENTGVRLTGYILKAKESGPESCNGNIDSLRDYHIWLSDDTSGDRSKAMIVEITPRWKVVHPEWRLRYLQHLAERRARVRVEGWLMWDEEHASEVDRSRATQWEVHPVTNLEVLSGNEWRPLAVK